VAETRHMTKSSSQLALAELPRASPTSIAPGPDGHHRRLGEFSCELSMRVSAHQIEIVKHRRLVQFYSTYNCGNALPHPSS
jgi:hypothetical protein